MTTKAEIRSKFLSVMSSVDIYETADENYLHVEDTQISGDHFILEVKEYFGHTNELGEPCGSASEDDFHVVFEYESNDDVTYTKKFEDVSIYPEWQPLTRGDIQVGQLFRLDVGNGDVLGIIAREYLEGEQTAVVRVNGIKLSEYRETIPTLVDYLNSERAVKINGEGQYDN
jgi:hypothetical protein